MGVEGEIGNREMEEWTNVRCAFRSDWFLCPFIHSKKDCDELDYAKDCTRPSVRKVNKSPLYIHSIYKGQVLALLEPLSSLGERDLGCSLSFTMW